MCSMFKILSTCVLVGKKYIKCNIWRVAICQSYIKDAWFLKVKTVQKCFHIYSRKENVRSASNGKRTVPGRWIINAHKVWSLGS
jgi:hypothetical protein